MRKTQAFLNTISDLLKKLWAVALALAIILGIQGCTHETLRRKTEIWLVDGEADVLYRVTSPGQEQAIPIKGNSKAMDNFMCIDKTEADYWIEEMVE